VQVGQDRAADVASEVAGAGDDSAGAGDQRLGGLDGDLVVARSGSVPGMVATASVMAIRSAWYSASSDHISCLSPSGSRERSTRPW
jgi:hypothetical protein